MPYNEALFKSRCSRRWVHGCERSDREALRSKLDARTRKQLEMVNTRTDEKDTFSKMTGYLKQGISEVQKALTVHRNPRDTSFVQQPAKSNAHQSSNGTGTSFVRKICQCISHGQSFFFLSNKLKLKTIRWHRRPKSLETKCRVLARLSGQSESQSHV